MATQIDLGAVVPIGKGDWNPTTTYERANIVRHNNTAWICKVETSKGVEPSESSADWYLLVKDTSSVTSVNGMKGDVIVNTVTTPPTNDNSEKIANTKWVRTHTASIKPSVATDTTVGTVKAGTGVTISTDGSLNVNIADTSRQGIVQLNNAVNSTSETTAATSKAVKTAYDEAVAAANNASQVQNNLQNYIPTTDGTGNGPLRFNLYGTNDYIGGIFPVNDNNGKRLAIDTYENGDCGAYMELRKGSDTIIPGGFQIAARNIDTSITKQFIGNIDGHLIWDGKHIVRSINGVAAGPDGNVSLFVGTAANIAEGFYKTGTRIVLPNYGTWAYWEYINDKILSFKIGPGGFTVANENECARVIAIRVG